MNLFKPKTSKKPIKSHKMNDKKKQRILANANPNVQQFIKYTSQFEEGLMHIVEEEYSKMVQLGEIDYEIASEDEQLRIVMSYADGLNTLDKNSRYQLLIHNRKLNQDPQEKILIDYEGNHLDIYREEINHLIRKQSEKNESNFVVDKYAIFSSKASNAKQANRTLDMVIKKFQGQFMDKSINLPITTQNGLDRLRLMSAILRPQRYFATNYMDIAVSGLNSKSFIVPNKIYFPMNQSYFYLGENVARVYYIRQYPKYLEDQLIHDLCQTGHELFISLHAKPYDVVESKRSIEIKRTLNNSELARQMKRNFQKGLPEEFVSGLDSETKEAAEDLLKEIKDNGQKIYSGIFTIMVVEKDLDRLDEACEAIENACLTEQVELEAVEDYREEALNTILPIGKPYLDVEMNYMRDMTTANVVTQIPFSNVELQSETGQYYGRNQLTNNMITIDRKHDLLTPSGLIFGTSGAGKGMATKWEIINTFFKNPNDRVIIVDPESEYTPIAREFDAQILDISTGTKHHLNILDIPDERLLDYEDKTLDLVKEKANLLSDLFESLLKVYTDQEAGLVDRVTRKTYQAFANTGKTPTLVDWHMQLLQEKTEVAEEFADKVEPFTLGSQDIFAHETNINLNSRFVVFNIKKLDDRLKSLAMKVILDMIWKQIVEAQGKETIHLYFDEIQLNFSTESTAEWFMALWSRIRKYGAIPTGITQNVSTLLDSPSGRKMISNSEFLIFLRQKVIDLERLREMVNLTPKLMNYINDRAPCGTGLISAGGVIVPFENPIPNDTKLFEIMNTDA
ncbi:TrsE protein [Enterococcus cecorum]|uniref:VirB4-like conjugal transfer ATPase, CD1110 family n=1 Tax=Enterococcus cecorum TaxID=44008 RepID=UPI000E034F42|nr:DUF87 domain-containing protein [Enterococcus cecorum]STP82939.1 TrsE protein [Enterococcus cecorum]